MAINVTKIKGYMSNEMNIIISGLAGTGKTTMLMAAAEQLGWKMQYYSASTLDPYTDLVGVPVPNHENKSIEYFRPHAIDDADVVFFDETNRADVKTLNTLFELIQFRSINGEKLPNLKCVVAAINPNDGQYTVDELDPALLDRFDVYLTSEPVLDYGYFREKFGDRIARMAVDFWQEYHSNYKASITSAKRPMTYISPRRMEKMIAAFLKMPNRSTLVDTLPIGSSMSVDVLHQRLKDAMSDDAPVTPKNTFEKIINMSVSDMRRKKNAPMIVDFVNDPNSDPNEVSRVRQQLAAALNQNVGAARMVAIYGNAVVGMNSTQRQVLTTGWNVYKERELDTEISNWKYERRREQRAMEQANSAATNADMYKSLASFTN